MKTIKTYTNDSDYLIKIIEKDGKFFVVIVDSCEIDDSKTLATFSNYQRAKEYAEHENEQYNFD